MLYDGVQALGLTPYLEPRHQGPVIVTVHQPADPRFELQRFVDALKARGVLISNFYNTKVPSFRIGCVGAVTPEEMRGAVAAIGAALDDIGVRRRRRRLIHWVDRSAAALSPSCASPPYRCAGPSPPAPPAAAAAPP